MLLDGALATTLQASGLPPFTPVNAWLESHPERIARVHQDFAAAGAEVVLAGTFRLQPQLDPRWRERGRIALELAGRSGRPVWLSVGPAGWLQGSHRHGLGYLQSRCEGSAGDSQ